MQATEDRVEEIDLLRALAITMVVVHHVGRGILKGFVPDLLAEAWTGVDLFFVISGYLVTRSFAQWLERAGEEADFKLRARLAWRYCLRRLCRILPPAWLWAALPLVAATVFNRSGAFGSPQEMFQAFRAVVFFNYNYFTVSTGISQINHFWSLAVEEHYYIFLPFFLLLVSGTRSRIYGLLIIVIGCEVFRSLARRSGHQFGEFLFLTHFRADALALGSLLGLLSNSILEWGKALNARKVFRVGAKSAALLSICFLWTAPSFLTRDQVVYFGFSVFAVLSAFLVSLASLGRELIPFPKSLYGPIAAVGRRSYSLYLIHVPLIYLFRELRFRAFALPREIGWSSILPAAIEVGVYLIVLIVLTELNFRSIEYPLIKKVRTLFKE